ncbi:hypothetical protein [Bacillus halotolerans]|uniref:hypothetical protein n=1 Tax=Bacillus halotolerans TaxID=260554 RepID=UPI00192C2201|nr:hypothetical protein [Bacillus halotolerans]MBL4966864.1 hypothetical protein [Bacillus halotolerans]MBL4970898.1 hypothetical protein [Bacillus halotolerans]
MDKKRQNNEILQTLYPLINGGKQKPVVLMLYGPAGVGKTETAKLMNKKQDMFRIQLSMFHNDTSVPTCLETGLILLLKI